MRASCVFPPARLFLRGGGGTRRWGSQTTEVCVAEKVRPHAREQSLEYIPLPFLSGETDFATLETVRFAHHEATFFVCWRSFVCTQVWPSCDSLGVLRMKIGQEFGDVSIDFFLFIFFSS